MLRFCIRIFLYLPDTDPLVRGTDPESGCFYHRAKMVRKTLTPTVLWVRYDFLPLEYDENVPAKSNEQKNLRYNAIARLQKHPLFKRILRRACGFQLYFL